MLVETVIGLIRDGSNLALCIAGDSVWGNSLRKQLEEVVRRSGTADRIHFLGQVENVPALLRASDIHVCPSIWEEPSPNVIVEAKREGIPTVAFPVGGIPELIEHGVDGYLCRDASTEGLVQGLRYFSSDAAKREEAGAAARKNYETRFSFPRFQRQWVEVFSKRPELW
jgi:glycosyltransferase involved in cell wall biosynthesis